MMRSGRQPAMLWPAKRIPPESGRIMPEMQLNSVVLPAPLGPIRPVMRLSSTDRSTPRNA